MRVRDRDMPSPQHLAVRRCERGSGVLQAPCSAQSEFILRSAHWGWIPWVCAGAGKIMDDGPAARGGTKRGETLYNRGAHGGEKR